MTSLGWRRLIGIVAVIAALLVVGGYLTGAQWVQVVLGMAGLR